VDFCVPSRCGALRLHALMSNFSATVNTSFIYDANGNQAAPSPGPPTTSPRASPRVRAPSASWKVHSVGATAVKLQQQDRTVELQLCPQR